ncbi:MAG: hypothetical protein M9962_11685 [Oligoflexia bacterium]|nr:hypothetical protein [Oligoflexia bacterium]
MRKSIQITDLYPNKIQKLDSSRIQEIQHQLKNWDQSPIAGFRTLANEDEKNLRLAEEIQNYVQLLKEQIQIESVLLLGTGGSSLGGEAVISGLYHGAIKFIFADNNDPDFFSQKLSQLNPKTTLIYAVSKSGNTPETISQLLTVMSWLQSACKESWKKHLLICTDEQKGDLRKYAEIYDLRSFPVPTTVGGRFSVLSAVGLVPAALASLNLREFQKGAHSEFINEQENFEESSVLKMALFLCEESTTTFSNHIFMPYCSSLKDFSRWFCQLWAESLGKEGKGYTPYPALGTTDQHSQVQLYVEGPKNKKIIFTEVKAFKNPLKLSVPAELKKLENFSRFENKSMLDLFSAELKGTRDSFVEKNIPNITVSVDKIDEYSFGALFYFWESVTAIAGALLKINPFDQPGVERAKILTKEYFSKS